VIERAERIAASIAINSKDADTAYGRGTTPPRL